MPGFLTRFMSEIRSLERDRLTGVVDFSYQHYALGDALTTQVNLACLAHAAGCKAIDLVLVADPVFPSAPAQGFINSDNYSAHLDNLLPAFLCLPQVRSIRLVRDSLGAGLMWTSLVASRTPHWPSAWAHLLRRLNYPLGHEIVNAFHANHGRIPLLEAPRGYAAWAQRFLRRQWPGRYVVCINPRQSRLNDVPATIYRDSPLPEWHAFLDEAAARYPEVQFLMLGRFAEWDAALKRRRNVAIPRAMGLTLAHELALLRHSQLFMGASSGFATMATFTDVPYLITGMEQAFARPAGIESRAPHYPFGRDDQHLLWEKENAKTLLEFFESLYERGSGSLQSSGAREAAE
jgi:hypothetical protein